jgi:hypothetical protein
VGVGGTEPGDEQPKTCSREQINLTSWKRVTNMSKNTKKGRKCRILGKDRDTFNLIQFNLPKRSFFNTKPDTIRLLNTTMARRDWDIVRGDCA